MCWCMRCSTHCPLEDKDKAKCWKRPNICYIFEKQVQGYQIHSEMCGHTIAWNSQEMVWNYQEMVRKLSGSCLKWSGNGPMQEQEQEHSTHLSHFLLWNNLLIKLLLEVCLFVAILLLVGWGLLGGIYLMLLEEVTRSRIYSSSCFPALHDK